MTVTNFGEDLVRVRVLPDGRMTRRDAALYIGIAPKTVAMWDLEDPNKLAGVKVGGRRFYYKDRLDAFIASGGPRDGR
ncbi:MAG: DNA-binding protein [Proteobacteria bacterium]|nr:DNA-binding protein [Pseudomonadota bacterium]